MTDPIADMLTRIRNSLAVKKTEVLIPYSNKKLKIAEILAKQGFVKKIETLSIKSTKEDVLDSRFKQIKVTLKYDKNGHPFINNLKRISKPGCRIYATKDKIPKVLEGGGIIIISTSSGLTTGSDARIKGVGGELICEIRKKITN
ncbi:30S ribosomal protein S8 [Patescibacteria group bacterium]|nr:30S ribosomal protein S8 [Patescibacteria group bacterium]